MKMRGGENMKKIANNLKEEEFFLQELREEELEQIENGGMCFFWNRCIKFKDMLQPICPSKKCKCYTLC